jgi:hypothetical protein
MACWKAHRFQLLQLMRDNESATSVTKPMITLWA